MVTFDDDVDIVRVRDHYEGRVNGHTVVTGDTWTEVHNDLLEMGYYK